MLLGHALLTLSDRAALAAGNVWRVRERTEHEAAALFGALADDLASSGGAAELIALARRCATDELRHAERCRSLVDFLAPDLAPLEPSRDVVLGPPAASSAERALFTSVALGCITESLSTALLLEMRQHAGPSLVRDVIGEILEDEVRHSRLGWAHLAFEASRRDVSSLASAIPAMLRAALDTEGAIVASNLDAIERESLRGYGILPMPDVLRITRTAIAEVIQPGLAHFRIVVPIASHARCAENTEIGPRAIEISRDRE